MKRNTRLPNWIQVEKEIEIWIECECNTLSHFHGIPKTPRFNSHIENKKLQDVPKFESSFAKLDLF
jgi:hypothetical protein